MCLTVIMHFIHDQDNAPKMLTVTHAQPAHLLPGAKDVVSDPHRLPQAHPGVLLVLASLTWVLNAGHLDRLRGTTQRQQQQQQVESCTAYATPISSSNVKALRCLRHC